jgi:hypothetical protein
MIERFEHWVSEETCDALRSLCQGERRYCDRLELPQQCAKQACPTGLTVETVVLETRGDRHPGVPCHADNCLLENGVWVPNHTPNRKVTAILYLDTCGGGDLYFWLLREVVHPTAGLMCASQAMSYTSTRSFRLRARDVEHSRCGLSK